MASSDNNLLALGGARAPNEMNLNQLEKEIQSLGVEIRELKTKMKTEASAKAENETLVRAKVERLVTLKDSLPAGHPLRPEERKKSIKKERQTRHEAPAHRLLTAEELLQHRVQRKISNVFEAISAGKAEEDDDPISEEDAESIGEEMRKNFRLNPRAFNVSQTGIDFQSHPILCTEKWDGTTVQADWRGIFKRRDLIQRGDPKKFSAGESERYTLIELEIHHPSNRHLKNAIGVHLDTLLTRIPKGITIYFEAVGPRIQSRFKDAFKSTHGTIRLFDSSQDGNFLPFGETLKLAELLKLPVVHCFEYASDTTPKSPEDLIAFIREAKNQNKTYTAEHLSCPVPLEGYVFRSISDPNKIAKLRVSDLEVLET